MIDDTIEHAERARIRRQEQESKTDAWLREQEAMAQEPYLPDIWTAEHVGVRLVEAADIVSRIAGKIGPRAPASSGRNYFHTDEEAKEAKEFEEKEMASVNRRERPNAIELARADQVIEWPMRFLSDDVEIAAVITNWADWKARDRDIDKMIDRYFYAGRRRFYGKRRAGLEIIASALNEANEAVT